MAERMVAHFGGGILAIIETEPGRLIEVHGLGPKRTKKIADAWEEQKAIKEVMVFLSGVGVSTSLSQAADNGHCYLPQPNLITDATKILEVDRELIGPCLDELVAAEGVVRELVPVRVAICSRRSTWWPSTGPSSPWRPGCWPC